MSTTLLPPAPVPAASAPAGGGGRVRAVVALLAGLLGMGLAVAIPLAPVVADRTVVTWPAQGEQPVSTTAFFVPYRPAEIQAQVPCEAVRSALDDDGRTTLLATSLVRDDGPASGLVVSTEDGRLRVAVNGRIVHSAPPANTGCDVRVSSDDAGTGVDVGDGAPVLLAGEPVPEIFAFTTDLGPEEAEGTTVTARTRTWFESVPSGLKLGMIVAQVLLVMVALVLLARWSVRPSRGERAARAPRIRGRLLVLGCDAAVLLALSLWAVIAPQTADDGYALMTIRNGLVSGDIGNYYHWFNAAEAPFTLVQRVVQPLAAVSVAPLWLRLPSYLIGILAWFVLSRGVLPVVLPAASRRRLATALAAVFFLAWWLPFNLGLRPEPFVALGLLTVFALLLRGTRPTSRRPLLLIGAAALVAGLCTSVTPSGVLALAPVLAVLPRIWRTLRPVEAAARPSWWTTAGVVALLGCLASTGLVVMFADQSLHGVVKATQLHTEIGPNLEWYQEMERYTFLMGPGVQGTGTKRLAVLLTIGMLLVVVPLLVRRLPAVRMFPSAHLLTATVALGFALLFVTPSKWSHHFGSLAGLAAAFLTVGCLVLVRLVRARAGDRVTVATGLAGAGILALVAALSFSGGNSWMLYDNYGLPFSGGPVRPLGNPVVWLVLGALATLVVVRLRSRRGDAGTGSALLAAPVLVTAGAALASVALLLIGFGIAPLRQAQAGSYSLARSNLDTLTDVGCGVPAAVEVLLDDPDGPLDPATEDGSVDGFVSGGGFLTPPPDAPGTGAATWSWGSFDGGERTTGDLVSRWFTLPDLAGGQEVAVSAAGRTGGGNRLELEFGRSDDGEEVVPLDRRPVVGGPADLPTWRPLSVGAADVPADADRVRVLATDATTDVGGWLAVTGPRVRTAQGLQAFLDTRGPVLPDWPLAWHVPCLTDFPVVADGLAETPDVVLAAPGGYAGLAAIAYVPEQGGSFAGVSQARAEEVPSRLVGAPQEDWGRVLRLDYPLGRDLYDRTTDEVTLWGWEGDR